jgi:hypothetical protein
MDKAHSGVRGLVRKAFPKCCLPGPAPPKFYDEGKSDVESVRRYRMDLPEEDEYEEDVEGDHEKMISPAPDQNPRRVPLRSMTATIPAQRKARARWGCF